MSALSPDTLVVFARVASTPTLIFALRRICKSWRDAVDSIDERSCVWQELLLAFGVAGQLPQEANKKAAFVLLLCEPRALIQRCVEHVEHIKSNSAAWSISSQTEINLNRPAQDDLLLLLNWVLQVGEEAATRWLLKINDVLMRKPIFETALAFCTVALSPDGQKKVLQARIHQEWQKRAPELAARIAIYMKDAAQEDKRLALASLESLTRKVGVRLLGPLNRGHVRRFSLPTTELIGEEACNLLRERLFN